MCFHILLVRANIIYLNSKIKLRMKQVIIIRQELKMDKGKLAVQCSHASVEAVLRSDKRLVKKWLNSGAKKVVLKVQTLKELLYCKRTAEQSNLVTALITDSAKTFFKEPTTTCLAIGPDEEGKIDMITGNLKMI